MSCDRQRGFAVSLLVSGLLVLLMGLGGSWGSVAYGQTGGPPPTPEVGPPLPNVVQPAVGGAEGEPPASSPPEAVAGESGEAEDVPAAVAQPARPEAVAGESGVADEASAGEAPASVRPEAVAGESGVSDAAVEGTPSLIGNTGAASVAQWWLLLAGMLLLAGGGLMFARARKAQ